MAQREATVQRKGDHPAMASWPTDQNGNPMALITMQCSILIGLPNYSNVTVGPVAVWRFVEDTDLEVDRGLRNAGTIVEDVLADEAERVQKMINKPGTS
jgi:predicted DNA-binding protein (UPF0278 family)